MSAKTATSRLPRASQTFSTGRRHSLSASPHMRGERPSGRSLSGSDRTISGKLTVPEKTRFFKESEENSLPHNDGKSDICDTITIKVTDVDAETDTEIDSESDTAQLALRRSRGRSNSLPNGILRNNLKPITPMLDISEDEDPDSARGRRGRRVSFSVPMSRDNDSALHHPTTPRDPKRLSKLLVQVDRDPLPAGSTVFQQVLAEVGPPKDSIPSSPCKKEKVKTLHITKKDKHRHNATFS